jgi:hypothetical protein
VDHQRLGEDNPGVAGRVEDIPAAEGLPAAGSLDLAVVEGHAAEDILGAEAHQVLVAAADIDLKAEDLLETAASHCAEVEGIALVVVLVLLLAVVEVAPLAEAARHSRWNLGFVAMGTVVAEAAAGVSVRLREAVAVLETRHLEVVH